jgi:hypothetical protein
MEARMRWLTLVIAISAALGIAACGGGNKASTPNKDVEDQLGFDQSSVITRQSKVESAIRDCMKAQGFDYTPIDPFAQRAAITGSARLSDDDFLKQFGYGITTFWGRGSAQADPNQRLMLSMNPADRRAYERALWGDNAGATFSGAMENGDFAKLGGCTKQATEKVFGGAQVLTELQGKLDSLDERIDSDQRMVRAKQQWASCMANAGFRYDEPDSIDADLYKRFEQIVGPAPAQFATGPAPGVAPPPFDHAALAALQRDEVSTARADSGCEHKDITPVENVVRPQYEAQFRQQNQALIGQVKPVG